MGQIPDHMTPEKWLNHIFASKTARIGGVVQRQIRDVERIVGRDVFLMEVRDRGFQVVENNRHFVIFCNPHPVRKLRLRNGFPKPFRAVLQNRDKGA